MCLYLIIINIHIIMTIRIKVLMKCLTVIF